MPLPSLPPRSPGRPKGARNRLAYRVFEDIFKHWCEPAMPGSKLCKGQEALETLYRDKPGEYLRLTASVLPKEFVFESAVNGQEALVQRCLVLEHRLQSVSLVRCRVAVGSPVRLLVVLVRLHGKFLSASSEDRRVAAER